MEENILERVEIAKPCLAGWDEMTGSDRVRFCRQCQLSVYNISQLSWRQAENLISEREGRVCIRLYRRHDGMVITKDCNIVLRKIKDSARTVSRIAATIVSFFLATILTKAEPVNKDSTKNCEQKQAVDNIKMSKVGATFNRCWHT